MSGEPGGSWPSVVWAGALVGLLATGASLLATYVPSLDDAFASVLYEHRRGGLGDTVRAAHLWLAQLALLALVIDLVDRFLRGRYRERQDRRRWWTGGAVLVLVFLGSFTGMLLPMDQNAYWGTTVRLQIVESVPWVGGLLADLLRGGSEIGVLSLPRFFAVHVSILPLALVALLATGRRQMVHEKHPRRLSLVAGAALVVVVAIAAGPLGVELGPAADPGSGDFQPRPEWIFLWLFELGRLAPGAPWLRSVLVPCVAAGALTLTPLFPLPSRRLRVSIAVLAVGVVLGLSASAVWRDREQPPSPTWEEDREQRARQLYAALCLECHGETGAGDGARSRSFALETPAFASVPAERWPRWSQVVAEGRGEKMPAFGERLGAEEIEALLELLTALAAGEIRVEAPAAPDLLDQAGG